MAKPHVVILGAGPAGLGAAFQLSCRGLARVTVLEANSYVGGAAGSFELDGVQVDYGSHRLHPACDPRVLQDIRELLGHDLLDRPRHGRIRLHDRWIHFPLKPLDLMLKVPGNFAVGVLRDLVSKQFQRYAKYPNEETFESVLQAGLGKTICQEFYFPYARKIWGLEPHELSATQARRRVSANSPVRMVRKVLATVPGLKPKGAGRFYYPRHGFGQISEAYCRAAQKAGASFVLNARARMVEVGKNHSHRVHYEQDGQSQSISADYVWSTIPITALTRLLHPTPPLQYSSATEGITYRAMILVYLVLEQERFSEYDAHYFPESGIPISRLSEPKNYSDGAGLDNVTVICAELPCSPGDPVWGKNDEELSRLVCSSLNKAGIPVRSPVKRVVTRRLGQAYPIYRRGYEKYFNQLDYWVGQTEGILTFGRQGLFAHDNTHHALSMAYSAVDCLNEDGSFDLGQWQHYRQVFETHVVED